MHLGERRKILNYATIPNNDMVSSGVHCNDDSGLIVDNPSSLSYCHASSLDFSTSSTPNVSHACVDSPCISCRNCLTKSHDDMLAISCCHDKKMHVFPRVVVLTM